MRYALTIFDWKKNNKVVFNIDIREYFTYVVGNFLDISVLNRQACPELPGLPLSLFVQEISGKLYNKWHS